MTRQEQEILVITDKLKEYRRCLHNISRDVTDNPSDYYKVRGAVVYLEKVIGSLMDFGKES